MLPHSGVGSQVWMPGLRAWRGPPTPARGTAHLAAGKAALRRRQTVQAHGRPARSQGGFHTDRAGALPDSLELSWCVCVCVCVCEVVHARISEYVCVPVCK